uniref:Uncharacterized protein n=1 Tax=Megaselia scalaris TaxID=36166 RepID=T1GNS7_MEGSC
MQLLTNVCISILGFCLELSEILIIHYLSIMSVKFQSGSMNAFVELMLFARNSWNTGPISVEIT